MAGRSSNHTEILDFKMAKTKTRSKVKKVKNKSSESALNLPVFRFVQDSVIVYGDDAVRDAAKLMRDRQVGSVIVAEKSGEVVGIVTEWDLIARVLASDRDIERTRVREVMSAPLLKVNSDLRAQDALKIMINRGLRRLAVMEDGVLMGTITQSQIVGNRRQRATPLPIVESIKGHQCPFCNLNFATRKGLLSHVEAMHKGSQYPGARRQARTSGKVLDPTFPRRSYQGEESKGENQGAFDLVRRRRRIGRRRRQRR